MRCLSCKYDLRHLTEHRCPECGRAFDPNDPQTFEVEVQPSALEYIVVIAGWIFLALAVPAMVSGWIVLVDVTYVVAFIAASAYVLIWLKARLKSF